MVFLLARLIPGDPCPAILGEKATPEVCDRFIAEQGLDKPIRPSSGSTWETWRGDFGNSIRFGRPVTRILVERLPMTFELQPGGVDAG